jgi:serine/threonine protein kinase
MTLERGTLLNKRYRIVEILGQGGMAAVYRAIDENLGTDVAVKENLFTTDEYARQFRREAVILANLRHPNLPRVTDHFVIEHQGQYLVMDYIEGEDLRQRLERIGPLPDEEVMIIGVALCEALTYLHTRNPQVLHRDIKPGNVKITPGGQIYLVDFGLAKVVSGRQATTTGARAMTPGYSPPEQYGTARTDHRSDIYSLGATLYSALCDAIPEDGLARAMEQTSLTPLTRRNPKVSKRLAAIIEKAMAVKPDDRYQTAEEYKIDLLNTRSTTRRKQPFDLMVEPPPSENGQRFMETALEAEAAEEGDNLFSFPISTPLNELPFQPKARRRGQAWIGWLAGFFLLAVLAGIIFINPDLSSRLSALAQLLPGLWLEPTSTQEIIAAATSTQTPSPSATLTLQPSPTPSLTPTATQRPTSTPTPTVQPTPFGGGFGQIAFASDRGGALPQIYLLNVDGTGLQQLSDEPAGACQPSWSPDGSWIVYVSPCERNRETYEGSTLFMMGGDGSNVTPLPAPPGGDYSPAWSPDGRQIAFVSLREDRIPQIFILNLTDNSVIKISQTPARSNTYPAWSPDGKLIAYVGEDNQLQVMNSDGTGADRLARSVGSGRSTSPTWSPSGDLVIFSQRNDADVSTWLMAVQYTPGGELAAKVVNSDFLDEPSFSPDGLWVAASGFPIGARDIYIIGFSGSGLKPLLEDSAYDFDPAWRPRSR